jgi:hypothetical protein
VLREVKNAGFTRRLTLFGWRYQLVVGQRTCEWSSRRQRAIEAAQAATPVGVAAADGRVYWLFDGRVYWEDEELSAGDVRALVAERARRRRRRLERAHAALAADDVGVPRREVVPREVKLAVFERDGGRCVECGSGFELQYDHVIPFALGGASTVENLQILCGDCNRAKGASVA